MTHILEVTLFATLAGVIGTGLGGLISILFKNITPKFYSIILEYSSGIMISIVCFDLLPKSFENSDIIKVILGIVLGVLLAMILEEKIKYGNLLKAKNAGIASGILLVSAITVHNFPEGLAIGSGFEVGIGVSLIIVILFHDIPEGLAIAMPFKRAGMKPLLVVLLTCATGIPTGVGAFIGSYIGHISPTIISLCLSFAGGAMLYVALGNIVPQAKRLYSGRWGPVLSILGLLTGIIVSKIAQ